MPEAFAAALARILMRYIAGVLVAKGLLHDPSALMDGDVVEIFSTLLGVGLSGVAEGWWYITHKRDRKRDVDRDH